MADDNDPNEEEAGEEADGQNMDTQDTDTNESEDVTDDDRAEKTPGSRITSPRSHSTSPIVENEPQESDHTIFTFGTQSSAMESQLSTKKILHKKQGKSGVQFRKKNPKVQQVEEEARVLKAVRPTNCNENGM